MVTVSFAALSKTSTRQAVRTAQSVGGGLRIAPWSGAKRPLLTAVAAAGLAATLAAPAPAHASGTLPTAPHNAALTAPSALTAQHTLATGQAQPGQPAQQAQRLDVTDPDAAAGAATTVNPAEVVDVAAAAAPGADQVVTGDVLPTPQINGVVWAQEVVGGTVYAGGQFTSARPHGSAPGSNESPRHHVLAYDLNTGKLRSFAPQLNGVVKDIVGSPDGRTVYVSGEFTKVGDTNTYRVAAFDAATGNLRADFKASVDFRVAAMVAHGDRLYLGGKFSSVHGKARNNLAVVNAKNGRLLDWNPGTNHQVLDMAISPDGQKLLVGGQFSELAGARRTGHGFVSTATGEALPYQAHRDIELYGDEAGITAVKGDNHAAYLAGFNHSQGFPFEGTAAINWADGSIKWLNDCKGDTYDVLPHSGVFYSVGHAHNCEPLNGIPDRKPHIYQRALASTLHQGPGGLTNRGGDYDGVAASQIHHWYPKLVPGTHTGTNQAAWSLAGSGDYVLMGGEFTSVNGVNQQGLARFAKPAAAPKKLGPARADLDVNVRHLSGAAVAATLTTTHDRDSAEVVYQLMRGDDVAAQVVVQGARWWESRRLDLRDDKAPNGSHSYRIRVTDKNGNGWTTPAQTVTVSGSPINIGDTPKTSTRLTPTPAQNPGPQDGPRKRSTRLTLRK